MADLTAITEALAVRVGTVERHDYPSSGEQLYCYPTLRDSIEAPCAAISLGPISWDAGRPEDPGVDILTFKVRLYVSRFDEVAGQQALHQYLATSGPTSVRAALLADRQLGGLLRGGWLRVPGVDDDGIHEALVGDLSYLSAAVVVLVACSPDRVPYR